MTKQDDIIDAEIIEWESTDLSLSNSKELTNQKNIVKDILWKLEVIWVNDDKIAETINKLLDAKTLNWKWDEMSDNKVILDTLKLVLKLHWAKINDNQINVAIFQQAPWVDDKLQY